MALVQSMEAGVEKVKLFPEVTLDIEALAEYSGQGVCRYVRLLCDTADRYREELSTWARNRDWRVSQDGGIGEEFVIYRKREEEEEENEEE